MIDIRFASSVLIVRSRGKVLHRLLIAMDEGEIKTAPYASRDCYVNRCWRTMIYDVKLLVKKVPVLVYLYLSVQATTSSREKEFPW